jgi:hypothetical protein
MNGRERRKGLEMRYMFKDIKNRGRRLTVNDGDGEKKQTWK